MGRRSISLLLVMLLSVLPFISGCIDTDKLFPEEEEKEEIDDGSVVPETTKQIDDEALDRIVSVSDDTSEIVLNDDGTMPDISEGDILSFGISERTPHGLLREVKDIERTDGKVILDTEQATLEDAVEKGKVDLNRSIGSNELKMVESLPGVYLQNGTTRSGDDGIGFRDVVLHSDGKGGQVLLNGGLDVDFDLILELSIESFEIKKCRFGAEAAFTGNIELTSNEKAEVTEEFTVASFEFLPILIPIGPIVLVLVPTLSLVVGVRGTVSQGLNIQATQETVLSSYVEHPDWEPVKEFTANFEYDVPAADSSCVITGYVGPEMDILLWGVVGPYITMHGYLEGDLVTGGGDPSWGLYGGLEFGLGVKVEALGIMIKEWEDPDIIDFRRTIATSANNMAEGWSIEKVDVAIQLAGVRLEDDPNGGPSLLYLSANDDRTDYMLKYAVRKGGFWEYVDVQEGMGNFAYSMSYDRNGDPFIAYWWQDLSFKPCIMTCRLHSSEMEKMNITDPDTRGMTITYLITVMDGNGDPNIFYILEKNDPYGLAMENEGILKRAYMLDGIWKTEIVYHATNVSLFGLDVSLGSDGEVHLSFFRYPLDGGSEEVVLLSPGPGGWSAETAFTDDVFYRHYGVTTLRFAGDGSPYILLEDNNSTLSLVKRTASGWLEEEKVSTDHTYASSFVLTGESTPTVAYITENNEYIRDYWLKFCSLSSGGWDRVTVTQWTDLRISGGLDIFEGPDGSILIAFNDGLHVVIAEKKG